MSGSVACEARRGGATRSSAACLGAQQRGCRACVRHGRRREAPRGGVHGHHGAPHLGCGPRAQTRQRSTSSRAGAWREAELTAGYRGPLRVQVEPPAASWRFTAAPCVELEPGSLALLSSHLIVATKDVFAGKRAPRQVPRHAKGRGFISLQNLIVHVLLAETIIHVSKTTAPNSSQRLRGSITWYCIVKGVKYADSKLGGAASET